MKYYRLKRYPGVFYHLHSGQKVYGYRYSYYDNQHHRHQRKRSGFKNVTEAMHNRYKTQHYHQKLLDSHHMTFKQWGTHVLQEKKSGRLTTYKAYQHLLQEDVFPYIGGIRLIDLTPLKYKYQCWTKLLQQGLSENTVKDVNAKVQAIMNEAVNNNLLKHNPIKHTDISKIAQANHRPRKQIMTKRQLKSFNNNLIHHSLLVQIIYFTLERTGMRAGELLGLHWKNINMKRKRISIRHTRDAYGERQPKTENSIRTLTIDNKLNDLFKRYYYWCVNKYNISSDDYVIIGKRGNALIPKMLSIKLKALLYESGLEKLVGHFSCHTFRHQFASKLIVDYHIDPLTVSRILGHASPAITMKIYAQLSRRKSMNIGKILNK